jgi:hypothetical protein
MRFITVIIITAISALLFHQFLPWWGITLAGVLAGVVLEIKPAAGFFAAFFGGLLVWGGMALWINAGNEGIMAARIGELFGGIGTIGILMVTALFGGVLAGVGGLAGQFLRQIVRSE